MHIMALLFVFNIACNGQETHQDSASDSQTIAAGQSETNTTVGDPNFVVAPDIISTHGPSNITRNMLQDRNGVYWFASWEGIVRYDGKLFTYVTLKEGLRRFHVFSV